MTTDPAALAADAIAETWALDNGKRDRIQELIEEQFTPVLMDVIAAAIAWRKAIGKAYAEDRFGDLFSCDEILTNAVDAYRAALPKA